MTTGERRRACLLSLHPSLHRTRNRSMKKKSPSPWQMYGHVCLPSLFLYFFTSLLLFLSCCFVVRQRHDVISTSQISGALFISTPYKSTFYCFVRLPFSFLSFSNHNKTRYTAQAMPGVLWCFSSFIMSDFNLRAKRQCWLLNSWFSLFCPFPCIPILKFRGASSKTRYDYTVVIIVAKHWSNGTNET